LKNVASAPAARAISLPDIAHLHDNANRSERRLQMLPLSILKRVTPNMQGYLSPPRHMQLFSVSQRSAMLMDIGYGYDIGARIQYSSPSKLNCPGVSSSNPRRCQWRVWMTADPFNAMPSTRPDLSPPGGQRCWVDYLDPNQHHVQRGATARRE
jgi:hypothetical protein